MWNGPFRLLLCVFLSLSVGLPGQARGDDPQEDFEEEDDSDRPVRRKKRALETDEEESNVFTLLTQSEKELDRKRHRYLYVGAAAFLIGGGALGYMSYAEVQRAGASNRAMEARETLQTAQSTAASASLLYGLAALTLTWAIVMEWLPPAAAENPPLHFHF